LKSLVAIIGNLNLHYWVSIFYKAARLYTKRGGGSTIFR
jgi:hypothetical protein